MGHVYKGQGPRLRTSTIAERLAIALAIDGRDQADIERLAGIAAGQLSRWKGATKPDADSLGKVVRALGVSGHWLLTGEGEMRPTAPSEEVQGFRDMAAVVDRVRALASAAEVGVRSLPGGGKGGAKTEGEE